MITMYVIRHGQARFGSSDYDRLSSLGEQQAILLGTYLSTLGIHFDAVYSGPLTRQVNTARLVTSTMGSGADVITNNAFAELDIDAILASSGMPPEMALVDRNSYREIMDAAVMKSLDEPDRLPREKRIDSFIEGVRVGIAQVASAHSLTDTIAVFTSGGPVAAFMQTALALSLREAIRLPWQVMNTSFSIFSHDGDRMTLQMFNSTAHLDHTGHSDWITLL